MAIILKLVQKLKSVFHKGIPAFNLEKEKEKNEKLESTAVFFCFRVFKTLASFDIKCSKLLNIYFWTPNCNTTDYLHWMDTENVFY